MESPMEEAYRRLVEVITNNSDDKITEEQIHQLVASLPSVIIATDAAKRTPLHHAALVGKPNILRAILDVAPGSDVDMPDVEGCTALHLASRNGNEATVHALLRYGADVRQEEAFGETALHEAARNGHVGLIRLFVEGGGAVVDAGNRDSSTALHVAARRGHLEVVQVLLAAGANPATRDKVGDTPLHDAARGGHAHLVTTLLGTGLVSVDARNDNGLTPLTVGARHGREDIVRVLLERGADVDALSSEFCSPLHQAAAEGHDGVARVLIAAGGDVNLQDKDEHSALHAAVIFDHTAVVGSLLAAGAVVDLRDLEDCTPLHHAVKNGNINVVRDLLEAGADTTILSAGGETPQSLARVLGKESVSQLFISPQVVPRQDVVGNFRPRKARGPSRPNEETEIEVCKHFRGGFWCPTSDCTFDDLSVWDLLYEPETEVKLCPLPPPIIEHVKTPPASPTLGTLASERIMENGGEHQRRHQSGRHQQQHQNQSHHRQHQQHQQQQQQQQQQQHSQRHHHRRKTSYGRREDKPVKRWIHLPANNIAWVLDLVQKLHAIDCKTEAECARALRFVRDTFLEMRFSAPYRKPHFRREQPVPTNLGSGPVPTAPSGPIVSAASLNPHEMFSLVIPVVDVDMDDKTRDTLRSAGHGILHESVQAQVQVPRRELMRENTAERHRSLSAMPTNLQHFLFPHLKHLDAMAELRRIFTKSELHMPRTLDQSYHESLSREEVRWRNESQVIYRYLQRLENAIEEEKKRKKEEKEKKKKEKKKKGKEKDNSGTTQQQQQQSLSVSTSSASGARPVGDPFKNREFLSAQSSDKQKQTDGTKEQLMRMAGRQDVASSVRAKQAQTALRERKGLPLEQEQRKQVLMVSQLWLWRIDENNIISCYPERWDDKNAKTLLNEIKHRVLGLRGLKNSSVDMVRVVEQILESAVSFSEEEFHFQFAGGPRSYSNAFASSIAFVSNEVMKRYGAFMASLRRMRTSKGLLSGDLRMEIGLLQEIEDVSEEINMIQRVLREQERVVGEFHAARDPDCALLEQAGGARSGNVFSHPTLDFFQRLELDANRVRDSITTLLDLRQREANIEEALSANEQSKILFIFTGATVVFAPLSWIMGVFEVPIVGLPDPILPKHAALAMAGSLLATILVIYIALQIYEIVLQGGNSTKRFALQEMFRKNRSSDAKLHKDDPKKSSLKNMSVRPLDEHTARSSAFRSDDAAASAAGEGGAGLRPVRKRFIRFGRDGKRRLDEENAAAAGAFS